MANTKEYFDVRLSGKSIGVLARRNDYTSLEFSDEYINDPHRAILGLRFEENLKARHPANKRLPPWFSNLLPEGPLRTWIADERGAKVGREMELLAHVGHDLPGAVQVIQTEGVDGEQVATRKDAARRLKPARNESLWRFSLAGVAMKFSMREKKGQFTAPAFGEGGDWIVKLPDAAHAHVPLNEFAMMTLASRVGIEVPEIRFVNRGAIESVPDEFWERGEEYAYAIRRFDRGEGRGLIHIEDLAQVRNFYPDEKYAGSFETVANLIHRGRDANALIQFVRRLTFNVLIKNGDAHLKNWSLIYRDPRVPTLSPAYDIVATSPYRPRGLPEDLGLKFCGSNRFESVSLSCFVRLENKLEVNLGLVEAAREVLAATREHWPEIELLLKEQPRMVELIGANIAEGIKRFERAGA